MSRLTPSELCHLSLNNGHHSLSECPLCARYSADPSIRDCPVKTATHKLFLQRGKRGLRLQVHHGELRRSSNLSYVTNPCHVNHQGCPCHQTPGSWQAGQSPTEARQRVGGNRPCSMEQPPTSEMRNSSFDKPSYDSKRTDEPPQAGLSH